SKPAPRTRILPTTRPLERAEQPSRSEDRQTLRRETALARSGWWRGGRDEVTVHRATCRPSGARRTTGIRRVVRCWGAFETSEVAYPRSSPQLLVRLLVEPHGEQCELRPRDEEQRHEDDRRGGDLVPPEDARGGDGDGEAA